MSRLYRDNLKEILQGMLPKITKPKNLIYLDFAATTFLDINVKKAMEPFWSGSFGNPSALYKQGREAAFAVDNARKTIAGIIGCRPEEVVFTAGGTESINLSLFGTARMAAAEGGAKPHIISSAIEHHAVLESIDALRQEGIQADLVGVDEFGFVKLEEIKKAVRPETVLISIIYANNEIGTIEPIAEIGKWLRGENERRKAKNLPKIYFHTDACQAAGSLDLNVDRLGVDLMSVNASKIYGPKQTGFLFVRNGVRLKPIIFGGGQEKNLRSGTENVPGIIGLSEALKLAQKNREKENKRQSDLRDYFIKQILKKIPKAVLNGPGPFAKNRGRDFNQKERYLARLPNNINISFLDVEGEALLLYLDSYGIAASTGSACASMSLDPSHVILAIGKPYEYAHGAIRFTLGKTTTKKQLDFVLKVLPEVVKELRRVSPLDMKMDNGKNISMPKAFAGKKIDKFVRN